MTTAATGLNGVALARQAKRRLMMSFGLFVLVLGVAVFFAVTTAIGRDGDAGALFSAREITLLLACLALATLAILHFGLGRWMVGSLQGLAEELAERNAARAREATERQRAEARLAELLDFNQKIIAESTLGILAYKASGACVLANEAAALIVGESVQGLLGQSFRETASWHAAGLLEVADASLRSGTPRHLETQFTTPAGREPWLNCDFVPFSSGGEPHLLLIASDVTGDRAAERALRDATALAERANRAKTEFLANMSHEIRTPMNAIIGLTQLVLDTPLTTRQHDYLRKIEAASKALLGVLNAILDYSKIEAGTLEVESLPFSLEQVLQMVSDLFSARADEKGLSLQVEVDPAVPNGLLGDPLRLGQVLANLVANAIKFTDTGGVRVTVSVPERADDRVTLRFAVADTGIGIAAEQGDRLFQAFSQADTSITRRYGGTGLGLTISKRLVEMMGGRIGFDSRPGQGSIFHFTTKVRVADSGATAQVPALVRPAERRLDGAVPAGACVLLVEDNEINLMVAKVLLENSGLMVQTARNGREAVSVAAAQRFDVILMDIQMPEMDGLEATRAIRAEEWGRDVPIVAMTAAAMEEDRRACLAAGMNDHLSKPIAPAALLAVLGKWLRTGRQPAPPPADAMTDHDWGAVPASLPGFDLQAALNRMGTDPARLAAVLWRFAQDFAGTGEELERLVAGSDRLGASRVAHRVKGTAGTVGAVEVQEAAARVERELRAGGEPESLPHLVRSLASAFDVIRAHVRLRPADEAPPACDTAAVAASLQRLSSVLEEHELVPDALLGEVCGQLAGQGVGRLAEALRNEVQSYDYGRALETVAAAARALQIHVDARHG